MTTFGPLVSTDWLADHIDDPAVRIIDGSWRMPGEHPARVDYDRRHIKNAIFFDIDKIADRRSSLPHMLAPPALFEHEVGALGISNDHTVIVYDDQGIFSAARVWWTFRAMGHGKVAVLDGGMKKWADEQRETTAESVAYDIEYYAAKPVVNCVSSGSDVREAIETGSAQVLDARPRARFHGAAPEPRDGLRSGHMPNALSLSHDQVLNEDGVMRSCDELKAVFSDANVDLSCPVITSCGSGITAAVLLLALDRLGLSRCRLYDGSWAEWGDIKNTTKEFPVVAGD